MEGKGFSKVVCCLAVLTFSIICCSSSAWSAVQVDPDVISGGFSDGQEIDQDYNTAALESLTLPSLPLPSSAAYGRIKSGDRTHVDEVNYTFAGLAGDVQLNYEVWDVDLGNEVQILLNGVEIAFAPRTGNEAWGNAQSVTLPDSLIDDSSENLLTFKNTYNPPKLYWWGVRSVSIAEWASGYSLPYDEAVGRIIGGDQSHINEVNYIFSGLPGDVVLYYEAWDVDFDDEVQILLNGVEIDFAPPTGNQTWGGEQSITVPDSVVNDSSDNYLIFSNTYNPDKKYYWGVRYVAVEETGPPDNGNDPHANLRYQDYPANCLSCHADEANEMADSTHYQWVGDTPEMINGVGLRQGKLTNAVNSYCVSILNDWPVCGSCHVGRGKRPDDPAANLENIDCLACHNEDYATQRARQTDGTMGVANATDSMVRNLDLPARASCLACHAKAGGGDGVKRGDLSLATVHNSDPSFDVHMDTSGADLSCQDCHTFKDHKVIGKGSDLRPTDDVSRGSEVSCLTCHTDKLAPTGHSSEEISKHAARVACQSCHIPTYAKVATETHRDWRIHHDGSPADGVSGPGHPYTEKLADLTPAYKFWNRLSDNALLGDDARETYDPSSDTYPTSRPVGFTNDEGSKLYPFKYKTADQPKTIADNRLIALNTYEYLKTSGDVGAATEQGLVSMGYPAHEPYEWIVTDTYQLLNHGIEPSSRALQCGDCHGNTNRMDLQGELGYELAEAKSTLCIECHDRKEDKSFEKIHEKHVKGKKLDCINCHKFSRPERGLKLSYNGD
jgi:Cytochrome c bacterial/Cytochrome c554 and c-prime